ncbi:MAG: 4-alpha-glucanotransferase [Thermoguttaceae bacterium]|nr:4-alpha-glucanotransferase [Thermoguttaceae bacterium]
MVGKLRRVHRNARRGADSRLVGGRREIRRRRLAVPRFRRYRRRSRALPTSGRRPGGDSRRRRPAEKPSNSTQSADSAQPSDSTAPTLGVSLRCEPLSEQIAALRTAALRAVAQSPCRLAIFPIQDVLGLSNDARVNFPGVEDGNWTWRFSDAALTPETCRELRKLTEESGRV